MSYYKGKNYKREYIKTIGIKPNNLDWIKKNKGKKSAAGFLNLIINQFKKIWIVENADKN